MTRNQMAASDRHPCKRARDSNTDGPDSNDANHSDVDILEAGDKSFPEIDTKSVVGLNDENVVEDDDALSINEMVVQDEIKKIARADVKDKCVGTDEVDRNDVTQVDVDKVTSKVKKTLKVVMSRKVTILIQISTTKIQQ